MSSVIYDGKYQKFYKDSQEINDKEKIKEIENLLPKVIFIPSIFNLEDQAKVTSSKRTLFKSLLEPLLDLKNSQNHKDSILKEIDNNIKTLWLSAELCGRLKRKIA